MDRSTTEGIYASLPDSSYHSMHPQSSPHQPVRQDSGLTHLLSGSQLQLPGPDDLPALPHGHTFDLEEFLKIPDWLDTFKPTSTFDSQIVSPSTCLDGASDAPPSSQNGNISTPASRCNTSKRSESRRYQTPDKHPQTAPLSFDGTSDAPSGQHGNFNNYVSKRTASKEPESRPYRRSPDRYPNPTPLSAFLDGASDTPPDRHSNPNGQGFKQNTGYIAESHPPRRSLDRHPNAAATPIFTNSGHPSTPRSSSPHAFTSPLSNQHQVNRGQGRGSNKRSSDDAFTTNYLDPESLERAAKRHRAAEIASAIRRLDESQDTNSLPQASPLPSIEENDQTDFVSGHVSQKRSHNEAFMEDLGEHQSHLDGSSPATKKQRT